MEICIKIFLIFVIFISFSLSQPIDDDKSEETFKGIKLKQFLEAFEVELGEDMKNGVTKDNKTLFDKIYSPENFKSDIEEVLKVTCKDCPAKLVFFYGNSMDEKREYDFSEASEILKQEEFDKEKKTLLYIHGYTETLEDESIRVVAKAYFGRNDHNVIFLDWSKLASGNYLLNAVPNSIELANKLAVVILKLFEDGLDVEKLHVVGHSLGGQLSGELGRRILEKSDNSIKLKRISALDPANPPFYYLTHKPLSKNDAEFVDVIHTNGMVLGAPVSTGTVDFWPNSGFLSQLGCEIIDLRCSHERSWQYWAESVASKEENIFPAIKCKSWDNFEHGNCDDEDKPLVYMGLNCPTDAHGDYYLHTNEKNPFSKGKAGMSLMAKWIQKFLNAIKTA